MEKLLTVSIAAYNMESYIRQTLDSLIVPEILDKLEVFVVDDGGTDGTLKIAKEYETKYPNTFHAVHKENGGYGSTVNYSIQHSTGKYFKLLDGDDWFYTDELAKFVFLLESIETDVVVTPFFKCIEGSGSWDKQRVIDGLKLDTDLLICDMKPDRVFGMWGITYKTAMVKKSNMTLPVRCLYTDKIYSTIPFAAAETIRFVDLGVYCYRIGRDGQSVSRESRIKHIQDNIRVADILYSFYEEQKSQCSRNLPYILRRVSVYSRSIVRTYLLQPVSAKTLKSIEEYDKQLKITSYDIYCALVKLSIHKKFALYLKMLRLCNYGALGLFFSKIILPAEGMKNWA